MKMKWLSITAGVFSLLAPQLYADGHMMGETAEEPAEAKKAASFKAISIKEVKAAIEAKKVTIFDANGLSKYNAAHLPGAHHFASMDAEDFAKALPEDKSALIVAYCGGPT